MSDQEIELSNRIVVHPKICHGKPRIKGTRIFISIILDWLADGASFDEILESYPTLTKDDITSVLNYAKELVENQEINLSEPSPDAISS
ncbi:MAG: DUF433 domain-containing protein [Candidatus Kariarchaeaceae archaeon]